MTAVATPVTRAATRVGGMRTALVMFETRRLLRSPALWVAAVAVFALRTFYTWGWLPDLTTETINTAGTALLLTAVVMVQANLAATRDQRHGLPETLGAVPVAAEVRTLAAAVATAAVGAALSGLVMGLHLLIHSLAGPVVGRFDPYEPLGAVTATALAAVLGVAIGRWLPWLVAGPLAVFAFALVVLFTGTGEAGGWWFLVIAQHMPEWGDRPSGSHLVYLLAMTVLVVAVALLRHGPRPLRVGAAVAALAVALPAGIVTASRAPVLPWTLPRHEQAAVPNHLGEHVCEKRDAVTYCAYPGYTAWVPIWEEIMRPVVAAVPPAAAGRIPVVRQETLRDNRTPAVGRTVSTWMVWPSGYAGPHRALLAGTAAATVVGMRSSGLRWGQNRVCDARNQARTVVALWLAGQKEPLLSPGSHVHWLAQGATRDISSQLGEAQYGSSELGYARRLLEQPGARERIWAGWDTLVRPGTTLAEALPLLGLREEFPIEAPRGTTCR
ncbi:hypothetical protein [Streptosporangium sp. KLBMP 9127]|nr:hypothetical protein [Streptosporangium sp. KLBMP 9127]